MAAWRYEISLLVLKKYFSTLEEKFRISARPCNILYLPINYRASKNSLFKAKLNVREKTIQFILSNLFYIGQFAKINNK